MALTILVKDDNTAVITERCRILQGTENIDTLRIIIPKIYNEQDFTPYSVIIEYKLPISYESTKKELSLTDDQYKDDFNLYEMTLETDFTKEAGNVEIKLSIEGSKVIESENGDAGGIEEVVRNISTFSIPVYSISEWINDPTAIIDYNTLWNIPISNLKGEMFSPVILDGQKDGIYCVSGSYKISKYLDTVFYGGSNYLFFVEHRDTDILIKRIGAGDITDYIVSENTVTTSTLPTTQYIDNAVATIVKEAVSQEIDNRFQMATEQEAKDVFTSVFDE